VALRPEARAHPLAAVLNDVDPAHCPTRLNFHCHTLWSDGSLAPEALAEQALRLGLEHLAITDHHACRAHGAVAEAFAAASQAAPAVKGSSKTSNGRWDTRRRLWRCMQTMVCSRRRR
jgi:hypothetical protein